MTDGRPHRWWDRAPRAGWDDILVSLLTVVPSLVLAWFAFKFAPGHLSETGFAARNREPNRFLYELHRGLGVMALANVGLALARFWRLAALGLVPLVLANIWLYFATW